VGETRGRPHGTHLFEQKKPAFPSKKGRKIPPQLAAGETATNGKEGITVPSGRQRWLVGRKGVKPATPSYFEEKKGERSSAGKRGGNNIERARSGGGNVGSARAGVPHTLSKKRDATRGKGKGASSRHPGRRSQPPLDAGEKKTKRTTL